MGNIDAEKVTPPAKDSAVLLNEVFGGLRAEYFRSEIFDLFTQPAYWPELLGPRPCVLVGGRGTGKTTVLRGLSYEGQAKMSGVAFKDWTFIGSYWRVDTSVMAAFRGTTLSKTDWTRLFSHYVNLVLVQLVVESLAWASEETDETVSLDPRHMRHLCTSLSLPPSTTTVDLAVAVEDALIEFESLINNVDGADFGRLSILGRPLQHILAAVEGDRNVGGKTFTFLIDEYENFENYQQQVLNTLIKHSGDHSYTFKIGIRETGHRERATLNPDEQLIEPADYAFIPIAERLKDDGFASFAKSVCDGRLARLSAQIESLEEVDLLLPGLSESGEAQKLGVADRVSDIRTVLQPRVSRELLAKFDEMEPLSAYMVGYWAESTGDTVESVLSYAIENPIKWDTRLANYQHAMLYTLRKGRRGVRKFYCGWNTYVHLADGNIRYLLQLVNEALQAHVRAGGTLANPLTPELQSAAAQEIGRRSVEQLQGLSVEGADLTRLVLGLGRVFQVMASQPYGHTPEVSQFHVELPGRDRAEASRVSALLDSAVMHLAVRRFPTDKVAAISGDTKDYSYQLHPIFAPFFVFSYRSKRRIELSPGDIVRLVAEPRRAIDSILAQSKRSVNSDLPEQLALFREYYIESPC